VQVGYLGLGAMGRPMAANLAARFPTTVWNRTTAVAEQHAAAHGTTVAVDLADLAGVDVVCTCLPTDVEVAAVARALGPALRPGTVWLDHTSGAPAGSRDVAAALAANDVAYRDAPVSGGTAGAERGELTVMVGGDEEELERIGAVLDAVAARVVHVGPVGSGMAVKAVNNALLAAGLWAAAEGLAALQAAGVDASRALEVVNASSGRSFATEVLVAERVVTRTFPRTFALALLAKDVGIAREVLAEQGVDGRVLALVDELTADASRTLGPDADHVELVRTIEAAVGVELR
jgi:3-hydroxyisobutyrate dehydrogenase